MHSKVYCLENTIVYIEHDNFDYQFLSAPTVSGDAEARAVSVAMTPFGMADAGAALFMSSAEDAAFLSGAELPVEPKICGGGCAGAVVRPGGVKNG